MSQSQSDSMSSQYFNPMSPPVVKTRDQINAEIIEELEALLNSQYL